MQFLNQALVLLSLAASINASKGKIDEKKLLRGQKVLQNDVFVLHEIDRKLNSGSKYGDDYKTSGSKYGDDYKASGSKYGDDYKTSGSKYGGSKSTGGSRSLDINEGDIFKNDQHSKLNTLSIESCSDPAVGTLKRNVGSFVYFPEPDFVGLTTFECLISDGLLTDTALITIHVAGNLSPTLAVDDNVDLMEDTPTVFDPKINDAEGVTIYSYSKPMHGSIVSNGDGTLTYVPDENYYGPDEFEYTVTDGTNTDVASVYINVIPVADLPVATPDEVTTPQDQAVVIDVLENDSDPDGNDISVASHTQPADGTIVSDGDSITYTPNPGFVGQDTFEYTISDSEGGTATTTVLITVEAVNSAPVTMDLTLDTLVLAPLAITLQDILGDAYDPDGDKLNVDRCEQPQNGVLGNDLTYTPNAGFVGQDSFRCLICDSNNACEFTTVYINVNAMSPTAEDDEFTTEVDVALKLAVLSNDISPDNDVLSLNTFTQPENGVLSVENDGSLLYTPNSGFVGQDTFTYKAITEDTKQSSNEATVTIDIVAKEPEDMILVLSEVVYAANLPPNVADITLATTAQVPLPITVQDIIANTNDPDGDELTVTQCDQPENGVLGQDLTYTSNAGFVGTDSFWCTVCDDDNACGTVNVFILVNAAAPSPPNAVDDTYTTDQDTPIILDLLANDSPLGVTLTDFTQPVYGTLTENNDGTFTYTPDDRTEAPGVDTFIDTFEYIIVNESGRSTGKVRITVNAVAAPPSAQNDYYSTFVNTPLAIDASVGVLSNDGDQLAVTSVIRQPSNGVLSQREDGSFTYIPQQWWIGTDTYEYEVTATDGQTATATVFITIQQPTAIIIPGGGTIGRNGTSSDCKLGFTDCQGVNTVSASLRGKNP